ncbi:DOPA 4,5-dioxygenase family protein [Dongshaea marina]|uniref:DOPA 4,5-dioxygenase family protein n=1 Tax=Dongshaea marina TaxID=2047966 RepID=UPI000D3EC238|nr:DOPA 4,5-dioxygenase family protein [Dongshaea marina]
MNQEKFPVNAHQLYHAHVYYNKATLAQATSLCEEAKIRFGAEMGRLHKKRVGPHPHWSCQLAFDSGQFAGLISWLEAHRQGLSILVHGVTGDDLKDHTEHAYWLGESSPLNLALFGG